MNSPPDSVSGVLFTPALLGHPIFQSCSRMDVARLLNYAARQVIDAGDTLFNSGDASGVVYWIEEGAIDFVRDGALLATRGEGFLGLDGVTGLACYVETAIAREKTTVISFPRTCLDNLAKNNSAFLKRCFSEYQNRNSQLDQLKKPSAAASQAIHSDREVAGMSVLLGWLLVSTIPLLIYFLGQRAFIDTKILLFSGIIAVAVLMWLFSLVPVFVPPLLSILLIILFDVAPPRVALSGYSSGTFFMCLSIFGMSALMVQSGLAYRLSLAMLSRVPARRAWYSFILFFLGVLLSLVVPSRNGRVSIVAPFLIEILGMIKVKTRDLRATQFIASSLYGATLMSPIFLTGSSLNLVLYGMFDEQTRYTYQWLYWLLVASIPGLLLFGGFLLLSAWTFRSADSAQIARHIMHEQKKIIGPMSGMEIVTLIMVVALVILIPTLKWHKVDIPWLLLTMSTVLLIFGVIGQKEFRNEIDWPLLIFIGAVLAWTPVISLIGLDSVIAHSLSDVTVLMKQEFYWFVGLLCVAVMVVRLVLPIAATTVVMATLILPITADAGISPWPVAFIILMMAEATVFPYQDQLRLQIDGALAKQEMENAADATQFLRFDVAITGLRIATIYAAIPFWKYLNII